MSCTNPPPAYVGSAKKKTDLFDNPTLDILQKLGLATINGDEVTLNEKLQTYVFNYPHNGKHKGIRVYILRVLNLMVN